MYTTPNMNLLGITIGEDTGLTIETNYNTNANTLDSHNHSAGSGVPITPAGLSISSDLTFNNNNITQLKSGRFSVQTNPLSGASDISCIYSAGTAGDLYFNDLAGNQIPITSGGTVNATSSGISSGTATASFISSILVVNAASNTPANIQAASILIGNNVASSNFITLSAPSALSSSYSLVLPVLPASPLFVTLDSSGNFSTANNIQGTQVAAASLTGTQLASATVTNSNMAANSVDTAQLVNGSVTAAKLASANQSVSGWSQIVVTTPNVFNNVTGGSVSITSTGRPAMIMLNTSTVGGFTLNQGGGTSIDGDLQVVVTWPGGGITFQNTYGGQINFVTWPATSSFLASFPSAGTLTATMQVRLRFVGGPGSLTLVAGTISIIEL